MLQTDVELLAQSGDRAWRDPRGIVQIVAGLLVGPGESLRLT